MDLALQDPLIALAALITAIVGTGRLVRLVTYDDYPPTMWLRARWSAITNDGPWAKLASCFWCFAPWAMLPTMAWFAAAYAWGGAWAWTWWLFYGWLALSYLTSMLVARDEPPA